MGADGWSCTEPFARSSAGRRRRPSFEILDASQLAFDSARRRQRRPRLDLKNSPSFARCRISTKCRRPCPDQPRDSSALQHRTHAANGQCRCGVVKRRRWKRPTSVVHPIARAPRSPVVLRIIQSPVTRRGAAHATQQERLVMACPIAFATRASRRWRRPARPGASSGPRRSAAMVRMSGCGAVAATPERPDAIGVVGASLWASLALLAAAELPRACDRFIVAVARLAGAFAPIRPHRASAALDGWRPAEDPPRCGRCDTPPKTPGRVSNWCPAPRRTASSPRARRRRLARVGGLAAPLTSILNIPL